MQGEGSSTDGRCRQMQRGDPKTPVQSQGPPRSVWPMDASLGCRPPAKPVPLQETPEGSDRSPGETEGLPLGYCSGAGGRVSKPDIVCVRQSRGRGHSEEAGQREYEGREGAQARHHRLQIYGNCHNF